MPTISNLLHHLLVLLLLNPTPIITLSLPTIEHQYLLNTPLQTTLRPAHHGDLAAITTIIVDAFSPSAQWAYMFPDLAHQHAEIWNCFHAAIKREWTHRNPNTTFANVIALQPEDRPMAVAVWKVKQRGGEDEQQLEQAEKGAAEEGLGFLAPFALDPVCGPLNTTRATSIIAQLAPRESYHFANLSQLYLSILATHPSYDGHGFAAQNLHWGMELAKRELGGLPVTLTATPAGWPVYEAEGFKGLENVTVQMEDGLGELWFEVARWDGD